MLRLKKFYFKLLAIFTNTINPEVLPGWFKIIFLGQFVLVPFEDVIINIRVMPADNTDQMIVMLTAILALKLPDVVAKINLGPLPIFTDNPDCLSDITFWY